MNRKLESVITQRVVYRGKTWIRKTEKKYRLLYVMNIILPFRNKIQLWEIEKTKIEILFYKIKQKFYKHDLGVYR